MSNLSHHMGYAMTQLGFDGDPRKWVGKTVAKVEILRMEFGAVSDSCVLFQFEDGSRGWSVGRGTATGIMPGPSLVEIGKSGIVTADEYGRIQEAQKRLHDEKREQRERQKRAELERLKKELGEA